MFHCSRRLGKTFLLCVLSIITAIHKDNAQIRFASSTQKAVRKMIFPIFKELNNQLPSKFKGKWNSIEGAFIYSNGSMIHVAGVNNQNADSLRGTAADLFLIDEASFIDDLSYLVDSVAMPQLLTVPDSRLIMSSSSPTTPAHEFVSYITESQLAGSYFSYTIEDGGFTPELIEEFLAEAGGRNSTTAQREYFNQLVVDDSLSIIPEWKREYVGIPKQNEFTRYYHRYMSMDIGVRDKTALLSGYYDFTNARLIVTAERTISGQDTTTKNITALVKELDPGEKFYRRVADNNNLILLHDLSSEYDIHFTPTTKESLSAMVNQVRVMVGEGRVIVSPECKELIACLEFGVFQDNKRKEFGRSKSLGHYDLLAALIYLVRNLDLHTNPIPHSHNTSIFTHYTPPQENSSHESFKKIFNI